MFELVTGIMKRGARRIKHFINHGWRASVKKMAIDI